MPRLHHRLYVPAIVISLLSEEWVLRDKQGWHNVPTVDTKPHKLNKAVCVCVCVHLRGRVHGPFVVNKYFPQRVPILSMGEGSYLVLRLCVCVVFHLIIVHMWISKYVCRSVYHGACLSIKFKYSSNIHVGEDDRADGAIVSYAFAVLLCP